MGGLFWCSHESNIAVLELLVHRRVGIFEEGIIVEFDILVKTLNEALFFDGSVLGGGLALNDF